MKLILLSDLHLTCSDPVGRTDSIELTWKRKLDYIFDYAKVNNCKILVAGDFFDKPRDWKTLSEYIKLHQKYEPDIFAVFGQHDMYLYSKDRESTSLGVLVNSGLVKELNDKRVGDLVGKYSIYGASWGAEIPAPEFQNSLNILVIHKNISNAPLFPGHEFTDAEKFALKYREYNLIHCGDIHKRFFIHKRPFFSIVNTGPLLRLEATEYNMTFQPGFYIYDTRDSSMSVCVIPHEPSSKVLTRTHIEHKKEVETNLDNFINAMAENKIITFSFKDNLLKFLDTNKVPQPVRDKISEVMNES